MQVCEWETWATYWRFGTYYRVPPRRTRHWYKNHATGTFRYEPRLKNITYYTQSDPPKPHLTIIRQHFKCKAEPVKWTSRPWAVDSSTHDQWVTLLLCLARRTDIAYIPPEIAEYICLFNPIRTCRCVPATCDNQVNFTNKWSEACLLHFLTNWYTGCSLFTAASQTHTYDREDLHTIPRQWFYQTSDNGLTCDVDVCPPSMTDVHQFVAQYRFRLHMLFHIYRILQGDGLYEDSTSERLRNDVTKLRAWTQLCKVVRDKYTRVDSDGMWPSYPSSSYMAAPTSPPRPKPPRPKPVSNYSFKYTQRPAVPRRGNSRNR